MISIVKKLAAAALVAATFSISAHAAETVRFATDGYGLGALAIIAAKDGTLAKEGVDADLQYFATGADAVDAVLAGQSDFGVIMDIPLLTRFAVGRLVSPAIIGVPKPGWHKLFVFAGYKKPEDLKGKKFGIATGTAEEFITRRYIEQLGLDPEKDVQYVGFSSVFDIVGAMKAGRIDAAWIWGEAVTPMKQDSKFKYVGDDSLVRQTSSALLVTTKDYMAKNHDTVVKMLKALQVSAELVKDDPAKATDIIAGAVGADPALIKPSIMSQRFGLSFAPEPVASLKAKYDFLVGAQKISAPYDLAKQLDASALEEALPSAKIDPSLN
jgi:ABC-type nitrate/sulfonate/bicarbonate transport system substrate-binding protein